MPAVTKRPVTLDSLRRAPKPACGTRHVAFLLRLAALARRRRAPADLPDHVLRDLGIAPDDARVAARRRR